MSDSGEETDMPDPDAEPTSPGPRSSKRNVIIVAAVVAVVAVAVGVIALLQVNDSGPSRGQAVDECHRIVKAKLKSPATASFDADESASVGENESGSGRGNLVISGTVDSQNGFGAVVRSQYICVAQVDGDKFTVDKDTVLVI